LGGIFLVTTPASRHARKKRRRKFRSIRFNIFGGDATAVAHLIRRTQSLGMQFMRATPATTADACTLVGSRAGAVDLRRNVVWRKERRGHYLIRACAAVRALGETVILLVDRAKVLGYLQGIDKATAK